MAFGETFLQYPELFPARISGEPWGAEEVAIDVAGGPYLFAGLSAAQEETLHQRFGGRCLSPQDGAAAVVTEVFAVAEQDFVAIDTRGWEYTLDIDYGPATIACAGLFTMARLELGTLMRGGLWTSAVQGKPFELAVEGYLRMAVAYRLIASGGLLLHSAGVADDGAARLFLGRSGAGKTTVSRLALASGMQVLSDDMNAVVARDGRLWAEPLPFTGELGQTATSAEPRPLAGIFRLVKGDRHVVALTRPAEAFAIVLTCTQYLNRDPHRFEDVARAVERILASVPCWDLTFRPDVGLWAILPREETLPR